MVRRIRKMLRLETKTETVFVHVTTFADDRPIEEIAAVELEARLIGVHVERASGRRLHDTGGVNHSSATAVQHEVVIVAPAVA